MSSHVTVTINDGVMEVLLDRPPANALDAKTSGELYDAFRRLNDDDDLRVAILRAADNDKNIFCAGWDLKVIAAGGDRLDDGTYDLGPGGIGGLPEYWDLYKPVIAAVHGKTVGGGFEMVLGADLVVATEDTTFSLPEMQRGFLPDAGAIQQLHHRIPYNVTMDLMLTGRTMDAFEARHWGLVRDVVPATELMDHARSLARTIAGGAPLVTQALKEFMRHTAHTSPEEAHRVTRQAWVGKSPLTHYQTMMNSDDFNEGATAFAEKRDADFKGS